MYRENLKILDSLDFFRILYIFRGYENTYFYMVTKIRIFTKNMVTKIRIFTYSKPKNTYHIRMSYMYDKAIFTIVVYLAHFYCRVKWYITFNFKNDQTLEPHCSSEKGFKGKVVNRTFLVLHELTWNYPLINIFRRRYFSDLM